jgi:hypothetical protein
MSELKTCFKRVDYDLSGLLHYTEIGDIGLPDIQRPFVWSNTKVRDLFDSMYRGFPVGYLLFWENAHPNGTKRIGTTDKAHATPSRLIVDGQQRLTCLFAVFRGQKKGCGDRHRAWNGRSSRLRTMTGDACQSFTPPVSSTSHG